MGRRSLIFSSRLGSRLEYGFHLTVFLGDETCGGETEDVLELGVALFESCDNGSNRAGGSEKSDMIPQG